LLYQQPVCQTIWNDVWSYKRRKITTRHNAQHLLSQLDDWIVRVSCNVWCSMLSHICRSIRRHFKRSDDTLTVPFTSRSLSEGRPVCMSSSSSIERMMSICSCGVRGRLGGISSSSTSSGDSASACPFVCPFVAFPFILSAPFWLRIVFLGLFMAP